MVNRAEDELPPDYLLEDLQEDLTLTFFADQQGRVGLVSQALVGENRHLLQVSEDQYVVEKEPATQLPAGLKSNLVYDEYPMAYDYFLVTTNTLNVRKEPTTRSPIVHRLNYFDKVNVIQVIRGERLDLYGSDHWYRVVWHTGEGVNMGFIFGALGEMRSFRLTAMFEEVRTLQQVMERSRIGYVFNYRHIHGMAPAHRGRNEDTYGVSRNQSAPGYVDLELSDFRYFSDGMLVALLDETEAFYLVSTPSFPGEYWVPRRYISFTNAPPALKQAVVIDDVYQNEAVFQLVDLEWQLISYTFATTGIQKGSYHFETPKGHFMAIEKRPFFWYVEDGTYNISGFAPYSIRFSGGGFIHGVPVELGQEQTPYNTSPTDPKNHREYLFTIGTTPRSHKCVRNFTSHAKFLYDWLEVGEAAFIIIE